MRSLQVQFTIDDLAAGERIVTDLLRGRLVACAQTVGPVTSRYWWNGSIEQAAEWMFLCKTTDECVADVVERIRAEHPYDVPEIVTVELAAAFAPYAEWIASETQTPPNTARS